MNTKNRIEAFSKKQKNLIGIGIFLLFLLFCGLVGWFIGKPMIEFVSKPEDFRLWVQSKGIWGRIAFIGMMIFQVIIALVPGEPLEIGAGYAFGAVEGTMLCIIGITLGSVIVFSLVKKLGFRFVELFFSIEKIKSLKILKSSKKRKILMVLVFLLPGTPKDLITYFAGLTDIKVADFIILAAFARLPSVITSTIGGSALGVAEYKTAIIVFAITVLLSFIGLLIYNKIIKRRHKR